MLRDIGSLTGAEISGLIEFLSSFRSKERIAQLHRVINNRTRYFSVLLENINKPHNASAVVRSCECFGIQDLFVVDDDNSYEVNKSVVMGSAKWINLHKFDQAENNIHDALTYLKNKGYRLVATLPNDEAKALEDFDIEKGPATFIFGNELTGVSSQVLNEADEFIHIPMVGFTESLNISVSAAIIFQNITHRLHQSQVNWKLPSVEKNRLLLEWLRKSSQAIEHLENRYFKLGDAAVY